jgi:hypothetical protein
MNTFKQICSTIRTLIKRTSKDTQIKFYKAMAVPGLIYGYEFWTITKKKQEVKTETAEVKYLSSVAGYTRRTKQEILKLEKNRMFLI